MAWSSQFPRQSIDEEDKNSEPRGLGFGKWDQGEFALAQLLEREDEYYTHLERNSLHSVNELKEEDAKSRETEGQETRTRLAPSPLPHIPLAQLKPFDAETAEDTEKETASDGSSVEEKEPQTPPTRLNPPFSLPPAPKASAKKVATVTRDSVGSLASLEGIKAIAAPTPLDARRSVLSGRGVSMLLPASPVVGSGPSPDPETSSAKTEAGQEQTTPTEVKVKHIPSPLLQTSAYASVTPNPSTTPTLSPTPSQMRRIRRKAVPVLGEPLPPSPASPASSSFSPYLDAPSASGSTSATSSTTTSPVLPAFPSPPSSVPTPIAVQMATLPSKPMHVLETIPPPANASASATAAQYPARAPSATAGPNGECKPATPTFIAPAPPKREVESSSDESDWPLTPHAPADLAKQMESALLIHGQPVDVVAAGKASTGKNIQEGKVVKDEKTKEKKPQHKISKFFRRPAQA